MAVHVHPGLQIIFLITRAQVHGVNNDISLIKQRPDRKTHGAITSNPILGVSGSSHPKPFLTLARFVTFLLIDEESRRLATTGKSQAINRKVSVRVCKLKLQRVRLNTRLCFSKQILPLSCLSCPAVAAVPTLDFLLD
jgi:hypothetical protein